MSTPRHIPELDGMRGVAVFGVMIMHFIGGIHPQGFAERAVAKAATYGVWGVDLFFVLSGFLITGILFDAKGSKAYFRNFYARRTLRIFPLYYAILLLLFVLIPPFVLMRMDPALLGAREAQAWVWPYLTNIYLARAGSFALPYISHFWSLAVEEHFYLVWPFVVAYLARGTVMRWCVILGLFSTCLRIVLSVVGVNDTAIFVLTPCRLDTLCAGGFLALAVRGPLGAAISQRISPLIGVSGAATFVTSAWHAAVGSGDSVVLPLRGLFMALFFGFLIFAVCDENGPALLKRPLRAGWLRTLGKYSYGLYVFHGLISYWMHSRGHLEETLTQMLGSHGLAMAAEVVIGLVASIFISVLSFEFFERPMLKLKSKFAYGGA